MDECYFHQKMMRQACNLYKKEMLNGGAVQQVYHPVPTRIANLLLWLPSRFLLWRSNGDHQMEAVPHDRHEDGGGQDDQHEKHEEEALIACDVFTMAQEQYVNLVNRTREVMLTRCGAVLKGHYFCVPPSNIHKQQQLSSKVVSLKIQDSLFMALKNDCFEHEKAMMSLLQPCGLHEGQELRHPGLLRWEWRSEEVRASPSSTQQPPTNLVNHYIAQEHGDGGVLKDWVYRFVQRFKNQSQSAIASMWLPVAVQLFEQLLMMVAHLHSKEMCHLDLDFANLVMDSPPSPGSCTVPTLKLIDFGSCQKLETASGVEGVIHPEQFINGRVKTKPEFCAPEVVRGLHFGAHRRRVQEQELMRQQRQQQGWARVEKRFPTVGKEKGKRQRGEEGGEQGTSGKRKDGEQGRSNPGGIHEVSAAAMAHSPPPQSKRQCTDGAEGGKPQAKRQCTDGADGDTQQQRGQSGGAAKGCEDGCERGWKFRGALQQPTQQPLVQGKAADMHACGVLLYWLLLVPHGKPDKIALQCPIYQDKRWKQNLFQHVCQKQQGVGTHYSNDAECQMCFINKQLQPQKQVLPSAAAPTFSRAATCLADRRWAQILLTQLLRDDPQSRFTAGEALAFVREKCRLYAHAGGTAAAVAARAAEMAAHAAAAAHYHCALPP
jgi:serine/threonine protein kinase